MAEVNYLVNLDMNNNQVLNLVLHNATGVFPASGGQLIYHSTLNVPMYYHAGSGIYIPMSTPHASAYWSTIIGGENTSQQFVVSTTAAIGPSGAGIVNANQFNGNTVVQVVYGGTAATSWLSGRALFGSGSAISTDASGFYFNISGHNLGIGTNDWLATPPRAWLDLAPASASRAGLHINSGVLLSSPHNPLDIGTVEFDGTLFYYIGLAGSRQRFTVSGDPITSLTGILPINQGGTNNSSFVTGVLFTSSGSTLVGMMPIAHNRIAVFNSGTLPTFISPATSGGVLYSNGTGWIVANPSYLVNSPTGLLHNQVLSSNSYYGINITHSGGIVDSFRIDNFINGTGSKEITAAITSTGNLKLAGNQLQFGVLDTVPSGSYYPTIIAHSVTGQYGGEFRLGTNTNASGGLLWIYASGSGKGGQIFAYGGPATGNAGTINIAGGSGNNGGNIFLQGNLDGLGGGGGILDLRGALGSTGPTWQGKCNGAGGTPGTINLNANIGVAGSINLSSIEGNGGNIYTYGAIGANGGSITTYGQSADGGSIDTKGGTDTTANGGSINIAGGSTSNAKGGSINAYGGSATNTRGGSFISYGGTSASASGGAFDAHGGTLPGGNVITLDGGGSLNTTGSGFLQLGIAGTRTTLVGTATTDRTLNLPNNSGTLAVVQNISGLIQSGDLPSSVMYSEIALLNDLGNITVTGATSGQVLKFNGSIWVQSDDLSGGSVAFNDLTDVVITTPVSGQMVRYDGTNWINTYLSLSVQAGSGINISAVGASSYIHVDTLIPRLTNFSEALPVVSGSFTYRIDPSRIAQNYTGYLPANTGVFVMTHHISGLLQSGDLPSLVMMKESANLNDLGDVSIVNAVSGLTLRYNGSNFVLASGQNIVNENSPIILIDDFMNGQGESGEAGELGWINSNGSWQNGTAEPNHPGITTYRSANSSGTASSALLASTAGTPSMPLRHFKSITFIIRPVASGNTHDIFIGVASAISSVPFNNFIGFQRRSIPLETFWHTISASGGTATTGVSNVNYTTGWINLRVEASGDGLSAFNYYINNSLVNTINSNIPASSLNVLPFVTIVPNSTSTQDTALDYFRIHLDGISR